MHTSLVQVCYWWGFNSPLGHPVVASLRTLKYVCSSALEHPFRCIGAPVGARVGLPS